MHKFIQLTVLNVQNLGLKRANCTASNKLLLPDPFLPTTAFVPWLNGWISGCVRNDLKFDIMICLICMVSGELWVLLYCIVLYCIVLCWEWMNRDCFRCGWYGTNNCAGMRGFCCAGYKNWSIESFLWDLSVGKSIPRWNFYVISTAKEYHVVLVYKTTVPALIFVPYYFLTCFCEHWYFYYNCAPHTQPAGI